MQLVVPVDAADIVQTWLNSNGVDACAEPLPHDLELKMPLTLVQPLGGGRSDVVCDEFGIRLYTYAADGDEAISEASYALAVLKAMERQTVGGVFCRSVYVNATPYPAHDTAHPDVSRACFTARVGLSASIIETQ